MSLKEIFKLSEMDSNEDPIYNFYKKRGEDKGKLAVDKKFILMLLKNKKHTPSEIFQLLKLPEDEFEAIIYPYRRGQKDSSKSAKLEGSKEKGLEIALKLHTDQRYNPSEILELTGLSEEECDKLASSAQ
ncbi:MAG: hypothetical protein LBE27_05750 [Deltaproteobacteria bacterium]|jgi:hypothetical protein|nr:hypothetical protein [Deltaproteobacteria bacterium]